MTRASTLADFLRARRELLSPAEVGLRGGGRRRTPGLRREEVATLAGVSIDYLVRLEQGRDTNPSPSVLAALAHALQLDGDESRYLLTLAARSASPEMGQFCPAPPALHDEVSPTIRALLDRLHPTPALVVGPLADVVGANGAWHALAGPLGLAARPNLARHVFTDPQAPTTYVRWEQAADDQVARLRAAHRQLAEEPAMVALLEELLPIPAFAERWAAHPVAQVRRGALELVHPDLGPLRLLSEALDVGDDDQQLVAWLPADDATARLLDQAVATEQPSSPAQLRVVGEA